MNFYSWIRQYILLLFCFYTLHFGYSQKVKLLITDSSGISMSGTVVKNNHNDQLGFTDKDGIVRLDSIPEILVLFCPEQIIITKSMLRYNGDVYYIKISHRVNHLSDVVVTIREEEEQFDHFTYELGKKDRIIGDHQSTADLLQNSGKVYVQRSQVGGGSPIISGFEASRILLMTDGIRMNNAIYRSGHLQNVITIDQFGSNNITIHNVPGGSSFGSDALGGVIELNTPEPFFTDDSSSYELNLIGKYSTVNNASTGHLDFGCASKKISTYTSFSAYASHDLMSGKNVVDGEWLLNNYAERVDGQDIQMINSNPYRQPNTGYKQLNFINNISVKSSENMVHTFSLQHSNSSKINRNDRLSQFVNDTLKYAEWYYGPQQRTLAYYKLKLINGGWYDHIDVIGSYQFVEESRHTRRFNQLWQTNRVEHLNIYGLNINVKKQLGKVGLLKYGVEAYYNNVSSSADEVNIESGVVSNTVSSRYPESNKVYLLGAYMNYQLERGQYSTFTAGLRYNLSYLKSVIDESNTMNFPFLSIEQNNSNLTGDARYSTRVIKDLWSYSSISTGFKAPNVDDVGKVFDSSPGNVIVPNDELKSEYLVNFRQSLVWTVKDNMELKCGMFYSRLFNGIRLENTSWNGSDSIIYDGILSNVQANANGTLARLYGVDVELKFNVSGVLSVVGTYSYQKGKGVTDGRPLAHIPPSYGKLGLFYEKKSIHLVLAGLFNGKKHLEDYDVAGEDNLPYATPNGTPAWYILNFAAEYNFAQKWLIGMGLDNITDRHYRIFASGVNAAGRNFRFTLKHSL